MIEYLAIPLFAAAYAIKGGQWDDNPISHKLASAGSVFITLCFYTVYTQSNLGVLDSTLLSILAITLAWIVAVSPSVGEEYGALLGRTDEKYGKWMPKTKTKRIFGKDFNWIEGHEYGVKKGIQRGVFMGALMTLATGYIGFILASFTFVPLAWLALNYAPKKYLDPWGWSEVLIGAVCFGVPFALMM